MAARGAAESESGVTVSAAPVGAEVDFRLPVDWKNLLKTACLAGAELAAAAPPEVGFRRDIVEHGHRQERGPALAPAQERIQIFPKNDHNLFSRRQTEFGDYG